MQAQTVDVRLFSNSTLTESWLSVYNTTFYVAEVDAEGVPLDTLFTLTTGTNRLYIQVQSGTLVAQSGDKKVSGKKRLGLFAEKAAGHFIIKGKGRERIYTGDLFFSVSSAKLLVVNRVPLNDYVAGVVESEGGHNAQFEYFKAQAVLARTWVLKNLNKHKKEGYNVKDDVSSQAYYSKAYLQYSESIFRAVRETEDTILVDGSGKPIFGAFHSNSGGFTVNSEDYWSGTVSYLRAREDSFSLKGDKAVWTKEIDKNTFVQYFAQKLGQNETDTAFQHAVLTFTQEPRQAYFTYADRSLKLRAVRQKFRLRSTYFNVEEKDEKVLLHGRGFGHGVGMSQEGAMRMAELGYCYQDILQFYFTGAQLDRFKK